MSNDWTKEIISDWEQEEEDEEWKKLLSIWVEKTSKDNNMEDYNNIEDYIETLKNDWDRDKKLRDNFKNNTRRYIDENLMKIDYDELISYCYDNYSESVIKEYVVEREAVWDSLLALIGDETEFDWNEQYRKENVYYKEREQYLWKII